MDWDPSPAAAPRRAESAAAAPARKTPASTGSRAAGSPASTAPADQDPSADAWARAVEQSPGVWTVGTESNLGRYATPDAAPSAPEPEPVPEPVHYEPAAAQIPEYAGVVSMPSGLMSDHSARADAAPAAAVAVADPPAAAVAVAAPPAPVAAVPEAAAQTGRQSLYQRLSNSPEAEAGRAKAPARATAATTVYVQDIPSADDETIEESGVFGRAAVERILGGKLVEERSLDGSPLPPRF